MWSDLVNTNWCPFHIVMHFLTDTMKTALLRGTIDFFIFFELQPWICFAILIYEYAGVSFIAVQPWPYESADDKNRIGGIHGDFSLGTFLRKPVFLSCTTNELQLLLHVYGSWMVQPRQHIDRVWDILVLWVMRSVKGLWDVSMDLTGL